MPTTPDASQGESWTISRVYFPAGLYRHPPSGLVQVRVVRRGSSYANIDLGAGAKRVFTRPGDLLVSLPDRPTAFIIEEGREFTLLQLDRHLVTRILAQIGGRIEEYETLLQRPTREPLVAELCRRLEAGDDEGPTSRAWCCPAFYVKRGSASKSQAARQHSTARAFNSLSR
jgi:AraC family transcriptional regulator